MLNVCAVMGRLTKTPEMRQTANGKHVTSFTLAVQRRANGEDVADFLEVVAWEKTAEFVCRYFEKGSSLIAVGRLQTRAWEDKQGNKRKAVEIVATEVHFAGGKKELSPEKEETTGGILDMEDDELPF